MRALQNDVALRASLALVSGSEAKAPNRLLTNSWLAAPPDHIASPPSPELAEHPTTDASPDKTICEFTHADA